MSSIFGGGDETNIGPVKDGDEYGANLDQQNNPPAKPADAGYNVGGIINAGIAGTGAVANIIQNNRNNKLERDKLNAHSVSQETRDTAESTYRQNREMMLSALQNFYAARGWKMPTPGSGGVRETSTAPVTSRKPGQNVNTALPTDGTDGSETKFRDSTPEQKAQAATGGNLPPAMTSENAQQTESKKIDAMMPVSAKGAMEFKSQKKKTPQPKSKAGQP